MITVLVVVALFYKVAALVGWFLYYKLRRERWHYKHNGSALGAAFTREHELHAFDNDEWKRRYDELRGKLTTDSLLDAFWFATGRIKGPGGGVLGYPGPQPPRAFAQAVADVLAEPDWQRRRNDLYKLTHPIRDDDDDGA